MQDDCTLIDGYAFVVQTFVGLLAISTLLIKRHYEWPQRPWLVWFFDTSKQASAGALMHIVNVAAAYIIDMRLDGDEDRVKVPDQCAWYLASILIDGTLLVSIMAALVTLQGWWVEQSELRALKQGEYGDPPEWRIWVQQLSVYSLFLFAAKAICLWVLRAHGSWYEMMAMALVQPFMGHRRLELIVVMMIIPACTAILQYWLMDSLLKADWRSMWMRRVTEGWSLILPSIFNGKSEDSEEDEDDNEKNNDKHASWKMNAHGFSYYVLGSADHSHLDCEDDESYF